jgi:hypothetical protein
MRMCGTFRDMYLVRRSLGRNGCGVKQRKRQDCQPSSSYFIASRFALTSFNSERSAVGSAIFSNCE